MHHVWLLSGRGARTAAPALPGASAVSGSAHGMRRVEQRPALPSAICDFAEWEPALRLLRAYDTAGHTGRPVRAAGRMGKVGVGAGNGPDGALPQARFR